jgi:PAS domain S-box-containing protein
MEMISTGSLAASLAAHFTQQRADLELYKDVLAMCPIGMFHANSNGVVDYVNPAYCRILGTTSEVALDAGWRSILHPEDAERVASWWRQIIDERIHHASGIARFILSDEPREFYYEVVRLASSNNGYAGIVISADLRQMLEAQP